MAKCIRLKATGVIRRVSNDEAKKLVEKKVATYVAKKEWRAARRTEENNGITAMA